MANTLKFKRGVGDPTGLAYGEPAYDDQSNQLWIGNSKGQPVPLTRMPPLSGLIELPQAKAYPLVVVDRTVIKLVLQAQTVSGTCEIRLREDPLNMLGSGTLAVSSTPATQYISLGILNALGKDDSLSLVVSNLSTPEDLSFTIWFELDS